MKVKTFLFLILLSVLSLFSYAENLYDGKWSGKILIQGTELAFNAEFSQNSSGMLSGTVDIPAQKSFGNTVTIIRADSSYLEFEINGIDGKPQFSGKFDGKDAVKGTFSQSGKEFEFYLNKSYQDDVQNELLLAEISAFVDSMLKVWNVPGASVAITRGKDVLMSKGFGYRDLEKKEKVTPKTLFAIGSATKAFTAADIALLVDRGKVKWDDKVKTHLKDFELSDPYITENVQILDLLCHRTGLPRHDFMWYGSSYTRQDIYERLKYLPFSKGLREEFQYQNHMFMTLGILVERVEGKTWEEFTKENILIPLRMGSTNFYTEESKSSGDFSLPYREFDGKLKEIPFRDFPAMGPAGTINSCSDDMAKWVMFQSGGFGKDGGEYISESSMKMMHTPQMISSKSINFPERKYTMYGLGWFIDSYRDINIIHHGGNIDGFTALSAAVPDSQWGIAILSNRDGTPVPSIIMYYILDKLAGKEPVSWSDRIKERENSASEAEKKGRNSAEKLPQTKTTHPLKDYAGEYEHPAYGIVSVKYEKGKLTAYYNGFKLPMKHSVYDVFDAEMEGVDGMSMKARFELNSKGDISKLFMQFEPAVDDIEFVRKAQSGLSSEEYLKKFTGKFALEGFTASVELRGGRLILTVAGQSPVELIPSKENEFDLKDMNGYFIKFDSKAADFTLIQPNGSFLIKRVK